MGRESNAILLLIQRPLADTGWPGAGGRVRRAGGTGFRFPSQPGRGGQDASKSKLSGRGVRMPIPIRPVCWRARHCFLAFYVRAPDNPGVMNHAGSRPICRSVGRLACRAGTDSRCGRSSLTDVDARWRASTLNSFLPEHSVSTCRPVRCRSYLWATSCVPARRVRAADCHHSPVRRLRGTQ